MYTSDDFVFDQVGMRGSGSVVDTPTDGAELLGDDTYREGAREAAKTITEQRLATPGFDVLAGTAGALIGLLA